MSESNLPLKSIVYKVNNVPTHIAIWDGKDSSFPERPSSEIVVMIPGNPGLAHYYYDYLACLHKKTNLPVWIIAHAGHDEAPDVVHEYAFPPIEGFQHLLNLDGQLKHKEEFLLQFTDSSTKIHLLGHSIGGWMVTQLLKHKEIGPRIASANLLFPTLEYIADTPNGFWVNKVLRRINSLILFFVFIFTLLPNIVGRLLVQIYFYLNKYPPQYIDYTANMYLRVSVIDKILFLAYDEMDHILSLDIEPLLKNSHRIKMVYSEDDGWAPGIFFRKLKKEYSQLYIKEVPCRHAFVLHNSVEMSDITRKLILNEKLD